MLGYKLCVNHVVLFLMLFCIPKKMIFKINKLCQFGIIFNAHFLAILNVIASKAILMKRKPGRVEQSVTCLTADPGVPNVHTYMEIDHEMFSSLPLIQEGL